MSQQNSRLSTRDYQYTNHNFTKRPTYIKSYSKSFNFACINCNTAGHTYKLCKKPITSYGIICVTGLNELRDKLPPGINVTPNETLVLNGLKFLLVQRRDTIGYIDFLRGKYSSLYHLKILLHEMTQTEHNKLRSLTFDQLWDLLWVCKTSKSYKNDI